MRVTTIIHERSGRWARQLRPRLVEWPVRIAETRSSRNLAVEVAGSICPIVLIAVEGKDGLHGCLEAVMAARDASPGALIMAIEAPHAPEFTAMARVLGATHALPAPTLPPAVVNWLERWVPLARDRIESAGWCEELRADPPPWEAFLAAPIAP